MFSFNDSKCVYILRKRKRIGFHFPRLFLLSGFFLPFFKNYFSPVIQCGIDFH